MGKVVIGVAWPDGAHVKTPEYSVACLNFVFNFPLLYFFFFPGQHMPAAGTSLKPSLRKCEWS
jgi:hypothetical protein